MLALATAVALILIIEGGLYALFPNAMRRMLAEVMRAPEATLRNAGMIAVAIGACLIWFLYR